MPQVLSVPHSYLRASSRQAQFVAREIAPAAHVRPADFGRRDAVHDPAVHVEQTRPFRPQQPFVAVGGEAGNVGPPYIQRKGAQALDGVHEEQAAAGGAGLAQGFKVEAKPA